MIISAGMAAVRHLLLSFGAIRSDVHLDKGKFYFGAKAGMLPALGLFVRTGLQTY
jgi:hypothetical protein